MLDYGAEPRPADASTSSTRPTDYYLAGRRRRHRLPDEPVQHRRRRPVPARRAVRRRAVGARSMRWLPGAAAASSLIIVVAMVVGAAVGRRSPALLKVTRGVSEVISTIMLNAIARPIVAYLLDARPLGVAGQAAATIDHQADPADGLADARASADPRRDRPGATASSSSRSSSASRYWFVLEPHPLRLRPAGHRLSPAAAVASGVNAKRMVITAMLLSGAVAGLVGMPLLLGDDARVQHDVPAGLGFTGIAHRAARPQQPGRHRVRRAAVGVPRRVSADSCDLDGHPQGDRRDHAGRHRARGRHRLRARPPRIGRRGAAAPGRRSEPAGAEPPGAGDRRRRRHDAPATGHRRRRPTAPRPAAGAAGAARQPALVC